MRDHPHLKISLMRGHPPSESPLMRDYPPLKNMSEISSNNLLQSSHEINSLLKKTVYKQIEKSKFTIASCSRYLARVIYKLSLNSWNTKYSQNVTCVCKNILSVKHILFKCPITTELFQKKMDMI